MPIRNRNLQTLAEFYAFCPIIVAFGGKKKCKSLQLFRKSLQIFRKSLQILKSGSFVPEWPLSARFLSDFPILESDYPILESDCPILESDCPISVRLSDSGVRLSDFCSIVRFRSPIVRFAAGSLQVYLQSLKL